MSDGWSGRIPINHRIVGNFDEGALISIKFMCTKCGKQVVVDVEVPSYTFGAPVWGDDVDIECECGAEYCLTAYSESLCWGIEPKRTDEHSPDISKGPRFYQYKVKEDYGAYDYYDLWDDEDEERSTQ